MPRKVTDKAFPRKAGSTMATAMLAAMGVNTAPVPIMTRPSSRVGRSGAQAHSSMPPANSTRASCNAALRCQRPVPISTIGASTAQATA